MDRMHRQRKSPCLSFDMYIPKHFLNRISFASPHQMPLSFTRYRSPFIEDQFVFLHLPSTRYMHGMYLWYAWDCHFHLYLWLCSRFSYYKEIQGVSLPIYLCYIHHLLFWIQKWLLSPWLQLVTFCQALTVLSCSHVNHNIKSLTLKHIFFGLISTCQHGLSVPSV